MIGGDWPTDHTLQVGWVPRRLVAAAVAAASVLVPDVPAVGIKEPSFWARLPPDTARVLFQITNER